MQIKDEFKLDVTTLSGELFFALLVILLFTVARFVAVLLHEVLGHGLCAELIGGSFYALFVSPAVGFTSAFLPEGSSVVFRTIYLMAGLMVEFALGIAVLLIVYPRLRAFFQRLFGLLLLESLLVHSSAYMALGALAGSGGDTYRVGQILPPAEVSAPPRFIAVGLLLAVFFAYLISREAILLFQEYFSVWSRGAVFRLLLIFWLSPLLLALALGTIGSSILSSGLLTYLIIFTIVVGSLLLVASYYASRSLKQRKGTKGLEKRGLWTTLTAFFVVTAVWLTAFGPTPSTAHGLLLKIPPPEEEVKYIDSVALNIKLNISADLNATVEVKLKGIPSIESPLDGEIWRTFEDRSYWKYYENYSIFVLTEAFNKSGWRVIDEGISGQIWVKGEFIEKPKVVLLAQREEGGPLYEREGDLYSFNLYDPWVSKEVLYSKNYIDSVNITWNDSLSLRNYSYQFGQGPSVTGKNYLCWDYATPWFVNYRYTVSLAR